MTQEHAKYEQEVINGTTYDIYIYRNIEIKKIHSKLVYSYVVWGAVCVKTTL